MPSLNREFALAGKRVPGRPAVPGFPAIAAGPVLEPLQPLDRWTAGFSSTLKPCNAFSDSTVAAVKRNAWPWIFPAQSSLEDGARLLIPPGSDSSARLEA